MTFPIKLCSSKFPFEQIVQKFWRQICRFLLDVDNAVAFSAEAGKAGGETRIPNVSYLSDHRYQIDRLRTLWFNPQISKVSEIDCLRFIMCPILAPVLIGFFSVFFFAAAINSVNESNKAGSTCHEAVFILRCLLFKLIFWCWKLAHFA